MDRQLNYDRTTTTIKPETLSVKTVDILPFKFSLSDADIKNFEKFGELMREIARIGGEAMARRIGNSCHGNFGVGTDEWKRFLFDMIESTVQQEPHLGENLKKQCLDYLNEIREREMKEGRL